MTPRYAEGDHVWVPAAQLTDNPAFALVRRRVIDTADRSILVDRYDGSTQKVAVRLTHPDTLGFLILQLGDLASESTLLEPLTKSILQYMRLLVPDDVLHVLRARTLDEVRAYMAVQGPAISHVILNAHADGRTLRTLPDLRISPDDLADSLGNGDVPRRLISLACKSGRTDFAGALSKREEWSDVIGPLQETHGAQASLFAQLLMQQHLLLGRSFLTSARIADAATSGIRFRHWKDGKILSPKTAPKLLTSDA